MADERSTVVYDIYQKAAQQFDYAVTGATGAMCTYILQTLKPKRVDFSPYSLETLALLVLIVSVIFGFKLLESKVKLLKVNTDLMRVGDELGARTANYPSLGGLNLQSGEVLTPERMAQETALLRANLTAIRTAIHMQGDVCTRFYVWRNRCLVSGFLLLVLARLSAPYFQE